MTALPGQLVHRSEFYYQLAQLTAAGIGLLAALQQIENHPPARSYRGPVQRLREEIAKGSTLTEALQQSGSWLPAFDITLIEAGEKSGRLDQSFRLLAEHYNERARLMRQLMSDLAYPVFLFHFAIFIFPFPHLFLTGDWRGFLLQTFSILIPLYIAVAFLIFALQSKHGESWRAMIEAVLAPVPVLGTARRYLAVARLAATLEALISAGVSMFTAWDLAATASGSPAIRRAVRNWRPLLDAGQTPAEILRNSSGFPDLFTTQYAAGEISGSLDETLRRLHQYYQEEGSRKLRGFAKWSAMGIYLLIVAGIASAVLRFYIGYFQQIQNISM